MKILLFIVISLVSLIASSSPFTTNHRFTANATIEYCTGFDFEDYRTEYEQHQGVDGHGANGSNLRPWGEHPILWKHIVSPELDFNPVIVDDQLGLISFVGVPGGLDISLSGEANRLNNYEAGGAFTSNGNVIDPSGSWGEVIINDATTTAIFAAMNIWAWGTPAYINYQTLIEPIGPTRVGIIDCVTLSAPSGPPDEVCNWDIEADFLDLIQQCDGLVFESLKMTYYTEPGLGAAIVEYIDGPEVDAVTFEENFNNTDTGHVIVFDPPSDVSVDIEAFVAASYRQASGANLRARDGRLFERVQLR